MPRLSRVGWSYRLPRFRYNVYIYLIVKFWFIFMIIISSLFHVRNFYLRILVHIKFSRKNVYVIEHILNTKRADVIRKLYFFRTLEIRGAILDFSARMWRKALYPLVGTHLPNMVPNQSTVYSGSSFCKIRTTFP